MPPRARGGATRLRPHRPGQPMMSSSDNDSWDASDDYALNEYIKKEKKNEGSVAQLGQPNSVFAT